MLESSTEEVIDPKTKKKATQPNYIVDVVQRGEQASRRLIERLDIAGLGRLETTGKKQVGHGDDRLHGRA